VGADWSEIVPALKLDRRIGQYSYLAPGLGIAGGNLERDLNTIQKLSEKYQTDASVVSAYAHNSAYRKDWPFRVLKKKFGDLSQLKLAVWGLSYKIDTHSLKNSPSVHFIERVTQDSEYQTQLACYDPVVKKEQVSSLPGKVVDSALQACEEADVLIILTPWSEFSGITPSLIAEQLSGKLILDPYGALQADECHKMGLDYLTLGKC